MRCGGCLAEFLTTDVKNNLLGEATCPRCGQVVEIDAEAEARDADLRARQQAPEIDGAASIERGTSEPEPAIPESAPPIAPRPEEAPSARVEVPSVPEQEAVGDGSSSSRTDGAGASGLEDRSPAPPARTSPDVPRTTEPLPEPKRAARSSGARRPAPAPRRLRAGVRATAGPTFRVRDVAREQPRTRSNLLLIAVGAFVLGAGGVAAVFLAGGEPTSSRLDLAPATAASAIVATAAPSPKTSSAVPTSEPEPKRKSKPKPRRSDTSANDDAPAGPDAAPELSSLATRALLTGHTAKAIKLYRKALKADPGHVDSWRGLGFAYAKTGKEAAAVGALRKYLRLKPDAHDRAVLERKIAELERSR